MVTMDQRITIKQLCARGMKIKRIARELHLARNTVRDVLRSPESAGDVCVQARPKYEALKPYADRIRAMVWVQDFIGTRILKEIRKAGYAGGQTAFYDFLREIRREIPDERVTERFETSPAEQGQFDWAEYVVEIGGRLCEVAVFGFVLGYSRKKRYSAALSKDQGAVFEGFEDCLAKMGGVPKEILIDNPKCFVISAKKSAFQWNARFLCLAAHYGFWPVPCHVGRARTKGKIERPFFYLEEHGIKGMAFQTFRDFLVHLDEFAVNELDPVVHSTTGERPMDRFEREKDLLIPLPPTRYTGELETYRKVSWDCFISFDGVKYPVPWPYAGHEVWVKVRHGCQIEIYSSKKELLRTHEIPTDGRRVVHDPTCYEGLREAQGSITSRLRKEFLGLFPERAAYLEKLCAAYRNPLHQLKALWSLVRLYPAKEIDRAIAVALDYGVYSATFIRGVLENGQMILEERPTLLSGVEVPRVSVTRELSEYQKILRDLSDRSERGVS